MSCPICVVGSISMDFFVRVPRFVRPGETLVGQDFETFPGGKGANQAVAASRLGAQVTLVGCVGDDDRGSSMRGALTSEGIDLHNVVTTDKAPTGVAIITVAPDGENAIVYVPGANAQLTVENIDEASRAITSARVLLLQGEVPNEANLRAIEIASRPDTLIVLNAAPAQDIASEVLEGVDVLVLNRSEASALVGDTKGEVSPAGLARRLACRGPDRVIVTLGADGAVHFDGTEVRTFDAFPIEAVDSTGAGDAFVASLAVSRGEGARLHDAVRHASAAGALAAQRRGGIPSLPTREEVEALLASSGKPD